MIRDATLRRNNRPAPQRPENVSTSFSYPAGALRFTRKRHENCIKRAETPCCPAGPVQGLIE